MSYENAGYGTFLVGKPAYHIGSLLWTKDLGNEIDQSRAAFIDYLEYLENSCRSCELEFAAQGV